MNGLPTTEAIPMKGIFFMFQSRSTHFWILCASISVAAFDGHSATVNYTFDNVILADGQQITGMFDWTYSDGDFEGGNGAFTALGIPYTIYSFAAGNLNMDIQSDSLEISGNGNFHDIGLDITLKLSQPFTPTQSSSLDLGLSFFECCGNGFKDQPFQSGSIVPNTVLAGDFDGDGDVDADDLSDWESSFGAGAGADANGDGDSDGADFLVWQQQFGSGVPPLASLQSVPEPSSLLLVSCLVFAGMAMCRRSNAQR